MQPFLDALRAAPVGSINNLLNDAAKVLSHFVPAFWSPMQASVLLHDALAMGLCSVLLGAALGTVQPMIMSMLHQMTPPHRQGEAVAMRMMVINASSVAMPVLFGVAGAAVGVAAVFWTVGASVAVAIRLAFGLRST